MRLYHIPTATGIRFNWPFRDIVYQLDPDSDNKEANFRVPVDYVKAAYVSRFEKGQGIQPVATLSAVGLNERFHSNHPELSFRRHRGPDVY